jgi:hypothetical protein
MPDDRGQYIGLSRGCVITITAKFPWWTQPYLRLMALLARCGVAVDPDKCATHIVDRTRFDVR